MKKIRVLCALLLVVLLGTLFACSDREEEGVTLTFVTGFDDIVIDPIRLDGTEKYMPEDPFKAGYTFDGWYYDAEYTQKFSAENGFTEDTTLYAKWIERSPDLPDSGSTEEVDEQGVHYIVAGETYVVTSYDGTEINLILPCTHNGKQVVSVKANAFTGSLVQSVYISETISSIDENAFSGAYYLKSITVPETNSSFSSQDGILYSKDGTTLLCVPRDNCTALVLPDNVTSIDKYALSGCRCDLSFGNNSACHRIGNLSLAGFQGKITLSKNISEIFKQAFSEATCEIVFDGCTVETLTNGVFDSYKGKNLTLPANISAISYHAFRNCTATVSFEDGSKLTKLSSFAFANFAGKVTIPATVIQVERNAFYQAKSTATVLFSAKRTDITFEDGALNLCEATVQYAE